MNWIIFSSGFALLFSLIVFLQGLSILGVAKRNKSLRIIGALTIALPVLGILIIALFLSTEVVFSREFGVIIIQGEWARALFAIFLLGLLFCLSWGWDLARLRAHWKRWGMRRHVLSIGVWLLSLATLAFRANSEVFDATAIYLYDIWWPVLPLWFTIGFTDIALTILRIDKPEVRSSAMITMAFLISVIALIVLVLRLFYSIGNYWMLAAWLAAFYMILAVRAVWERRRKKGAQEESQAPTGKIPLKQRREDLFQQIRQLPRRLRVAVRRSKKEQRQMLLCLAIIVAGLATLVFSPSLAGPALGVVIVLVGWGGITEVVTDGWFHRMYHSFKSGQWIAEDGPVGKTSTRFRNGLKGLGERLGQIFTFPPNWTAIIKLLLVVALLTVVSESLNYRKTIVQPFHGIGVDDPTTLIDSVDDRLVNHLAQYNRLLQPAILLPTSSNAETSRINYVQASNAASSFDAVLTDPGEFQVGTITIPANVIVRPVQSFVRPWFQIRLVDGNVISEGEGHVLVVNASNGDTWIIEAEEGQPLEEVIPELAEQLSFRMLVSEESVQGYGITDDWEAFQLFQKGRDEIETYESQQDFDELTKAIESFKEATQADAKFALAYYHLGLALQKNGQPWQAEQALRRALSIHPDSIPFKNALAYHLYFFDTYAPFLPAVVPPAQASAKETEKHQMEAVQLWHQITSLPYGQVPMGELASAYSGLCRAGIDASSFRDDRLAYFYCYKSQNLLGRLPASPQSQEKIHQAAAENLNNLGLVVAENSRKKDLTGWSCQAEKDISAETGDLVTVFSYGFSHAALQYYEKALELQPQDTVIQCNAAIVAKLIGRSERMDDLAQSAEAHYNRASQYLGLATSWLPDETDPIPYYRAAIREYKMAINRDGMYHPALNGYAYTYWVFRLRWPEKSVESLGEHFHETLPEYFARKALHLARLQQDENLEVIYSSTLAEVLIANGNPQAALETLLKIEKKIPDNYAMDEVRWELAQAALCSRAKGKNGFTNEELERLAEGQLEKIREHEELLEISIFRKPIENWLETSYELPLCPSIKALSLP